MWSSVRQLVQLGRGLRCGAERGSGLNPGLGEAGLDEEKKKGHFSIKELRNEVERCSLKVEEKDKNRNQRWRKRVSIQEAPPAFHSSSRRELRQQRFAKHRIKRTSQNLLTMNHSSTPFCTWHYQHLRCHRTVAVAVMKESYWAGDCGGGCDGATEQETVVVGACEWAEPPTCLPTVNTRTEERALVTAFMWRAMHGARRLSRTEGKQPSITPIFCP